MQTSFGACSSAAERAYLPIWSDTSENKLVASLFGTSGLTAMNHVLRGVRARANRQLMMALNERETANAGHFQQLCLEVSELP
jgi:hypothetical protein